MTELHNEALSLRNIQKHQYGELEKQVSTQNFPSKIRDLVTENSQLRDKQRMIEEQMKIVRAQKDQNFEEIVRVEEQIKVVKSKKRE